MEAVAQWDRSASKGAKLFADVVIGRYDYSPQLRYVNRYAELLTHLKASLSDPEEGNGSLAAREVSRSADHARHMAARKADGLGRSVYARHRVVPLVMGVGGWLPPATERELALLFQLGKLNPRGAELAEELTLVAYDAALRVHREWFVE
jgi:hypothetical protein